MYDELAIEGTEKINIIPGKGLFVFGNANSWSWLQSRNRSVGIDFSNSVNASNDVPSLNRIDKDTPEVVVALGHVKTTY